MSSFVGHPVSECDLNNRKTNNKFGSQKYKQGVPKSERRLNYVNYSIKLGFPFAKLLRNFCGTKRKIFVSLRISFARKKNNNLRNHSQKSFRAKLPYSAFAKLKFCAIPQLEFCAIQQFRKNQMVGDGVCFLEFNSGKILFWNVFLLVTFTYLTNDS